MNEWLLARKIGAWTGVRLKRGFTLIELLVVIAIIAILASILVPAVQSALQRAEAIACQQRQHGLGTASYAYAKDHDGWLPTVGMIHGSDSSPEGQAWAETLGHDSIQAAKTSGALSCPTALKVGLANGIERKRITFAGNRHFYWTVEYYHNFYNSYGGYPLARLMSLRRPGATGFAFCGDGRWWLAADGNNFGQQPTFLHGDATVANMPNLNFMSGTVNALFADGHVMAMRPGWGEQAANPDGDQIPCERPGGSDRGPWNTFWAGL